jgi:hypothetical protein
LLTESPEPKPRSIFTSRPFCAKQPLSAATVQIDCAPSNAQSITNLTGVRSAASAAGTPVMVAPMVRRQNQ